MSNKFGGFGGMPNMQNLVKQAQMMQTKLEEAKEELSQVEVEGVAGGLVKVQMSGQKVINKISIDPKAVDPDDVEMLEDLIMAAINDATAKAEAESQRIMAPFAGMNGLI